MFKDFGRRAFHTPEFPLLLHMNQKCKKRLGISLKDYSVPEAMKHCTVPVLFIHGMADDFVLPRMTEENYNCCQSRKTLLLIENAGHCMSFLIGKERYIKALVQFFSEHDTE